MSNLGLLVGPALAGVLVEGSARTALLVSSSVARIGCATAAVSVEWSSPTTVVGAGVAAVPALLLNRLPQFSPPAHRPPGRIWRRPGVDLGCWAGASAGAWRGLLSSFVPVALDAAGQTAAMVGVLVSVANSAAVVGAQTLVV